MKKLKIIGIIFSIISIIILGFVTTIIETKVSGKENLIKELEYKKEIMYTNWEDHQRYNLQELLYRQDLYLTMILDDTQILKGERDKLLKDAYTQEISHIKELMDNSRLKSIDKWYTASMGEFPPQQLIEKWKGMSRSELKSEESSLADNGNKIIQGLLNNIKEEEVKLEKLKSKIIKLILISISLQVIGLILIEFKGIMKGK